MNHEFRKGWRAACKAVAKSLRASGEACFGNDDVCYSCTEVREILHAEAAAAEGSNPPGTVTVVDEEGRRLL